MRAAWALLILMSLVSDAAAAPGEPIVGTAGGSPVTAGDLRRHGAKPDDPDSLDRAIYQMRAELALAAEAATILGLSSTPTQEAAEALILHLFGPQTCSRIPDRVKREHYAETRWRFVAPPAWFVEDLQLLCCEDARDCRRPEVTECLALRGPEAEALYNLVKKRPVGEEALEEEMLSVRASGRQAARSEYVFYHAPNAQAPVDGRLQTVDAPIAEAVSRAKPATWIGPVASRFGHHILRLKRRRAGINLPYESPQTQALLFTELCPAFLIDQRSRYTHELIRTQAWRPASEELRAAFGQAGSTPP